MRNVTFAMLEGLEPRFLMAAGDLDPTFSGGKILQDVLGGADFANAMATQSDGKVLLVGKAARSGAGTDFALLRFNADGSLDTTFGAGGIVTTDMGTTADAAYAVAVQADGKIVLAGEAGSSTAANFALAHYNADGSLDTTFGSGGKAITDFAANSDRARGLAIMSDGRIIVAGSATVSSKTQFALARYTAGGALDSSFDLDGKVTTLYSSGTQGANAVLALADGSIVAAGSSLNLASNDRNFAVIKYTAAGALDTTFGVGGAARISMGGDSDTARALIMQSDGKIVVAGDNFDSLASTGDFALLRLNANGSVDTTFGAAGMVFTDFSGGIDQATALTQTPEGQLVVGGPAMVDGATMFGVARYDSTGAADTSFAGGHTTVAFAADAFANGVAVDSSGNILLGGYSMNALGNYDFALARVLGRTNIVPTASIGGPYSVAYGGSAALDGGSSFDPDGQIALFEWDLNYDGQNFVAGASGATTTFSAAGLDAQTLTIALRITDDSGATSLTTTTMTILPAPPPPTPPPPTPPPPTPPPPTPPPPTPPPPTPPPPTPPPPTPPPPTPPPPTPPPPTPSPTVHVGVEVYDDPAHPGMKWLEVYGTPKNDVIHFGTARIGKTRDRGIVVWLNGHMLGKYAGVTRIIAWGGDGNDVINARHSNVPVELHGENGNDVLLGSRFSDVLVGGNGNDHLFGWFGDDQLDSGQGKDHLNGGAGNNILDISADDKVVKKGGPKEVRK